jgi:REP element-mobilizing transposase RayT
LITFVCYGTWLPGQAGALDREHNQYGGRLPEPDLILEAKADSMRKQPAHLLDEARRSIVLQAIQEVCSHRDWTLLAAHVRTNHVHAIVDANKSPEHVMNVFKAYASRALNQTLGDGAGRNRWARHGSTRYLFTREALSKAIHYVVFEQGEAMAVFEGSAP